MQAWVGQVRRDGETRRQGILFPLLAEGRYSSAISSASPMQNTARGTRNWTSLSTALVFRENFVRIAHLFRREFFCDSRQS
jgi:hypothetical protein